ncbi:hypothetical protein [Rhizobium rhizogenes]|uniref:hypothetical protein n=1 Tax=Rhizobium rhizogenes TaxID=359 RepID=UPI000A9F8247|nr:hypothetical protein [Rhizobium rhizogenes]
MDKDIDGIRILAARQAEAKNHRYNQTSFYSLAAMVMHIHSSPGSALRNSA